MKNYLPSQVIAAYDPRLQAGIMVAFPTILEANQAENIPKIMDLAKAYDDSVAIGWVQNQLLQVNEFTGVKAKLSDMQLNELSIQICLEHGSLNLLEFVLFCARLRSGKYEDFYGSVDPMRILKSLSRFCQERSSEIAKEKARIEYEERQQEWKNRDLYSVTFEDWYRNLPEEKKEEIRASPYFGRQAREVDATMEPTQKTDQAH